MWYKIFITWWDHHISVRFVCVQNKWELFSVVGYLFSCTDEKIERIDYKNIDFPESEIDIINIKNLRLKYTNC